ncbi:MAG: hypothetical protein HQ554_02960 [FCB group bacterium]|nr:hypothetical protein [FCB group bacterium]
MVDEKVDDGFEDIRIEENSKFISSDDFVNTWHDPDMLYLHIKQLEKNIANNIFDAVPEDKKLITKIYSKLELFRDVFQYLEEFGIYFLAYITYPKDIIKRLVATEPKEVVEIFKQIQEDKQDDFSKSKKFSDFRTMLEIIFAYDIIPKLKIDSKEISEKEVPNKIKDSINFFEKKMKDFANFYLTYSPLYTAIKHGTRVFPHKIDSIKITGPDNHEGILGMEYVTAICKDGSGKPYLLEYPADYLMDNSIRIAEQIHTVFSYLRRIVKYRVSHPEKVNLTFFKIVPNTEPTTDYLKVWNSNATIIIPKPKDLKGVDQPLIKKFAYDLKINGNSLVFHTKYDESISHNYPFLIETTFIPEKDLKPRIKKVNLKFSFSIFDLSISQYLNLINATKLFQNNKIDGAEIYDDLRNQKIGSKATLSNLNFPDIPLVIQENLLDFLSKVEKITSKKLPVPLGLSPQQESAIVNNIGKKLKKVDAESIISELEKKENKAKYSSFSIEKYDSDEKIILSKELGKIYGSPNLEFKFKNKEDEDNFKKTVLENPKMSIQQVNKGIDGNPDELIKEFESFVSDPINNKYPKIVIDPNLNKEKHNPKFDLVFKYNFGEPTFWHQDYFIKIIIKLLKI